MRRNLSTLLLVLILLSACSPTLTPDISTPQPAPVSQAATPTPAGLAVTQAAEPTITPVLPAAPVLWISPAVPEKLRVAVAIDGTKRVENKDKATIWLDVDSMLENRISNNEYRTSVWVYALVAAFPTVCDGVAFDALKAAWLGNDQALFLSESTFEAMKTLFDGEAGPGVEIIPAEGLTEALWQNPASWGIVPFEQIHPKLKVLELDGDSPLRKNFSLDSYPLKVRFALNGAAGALPATNRDPEKLVTLVMTGVTALVRATALKMELNGNTYPAQDIRDWLLEADIAHISNEIPFAVGCPYPNAGQRRLIFCSDPKYIELLEYVGTDVVELTGNHFQDWGKEATLYTLEMYRERGWPYFGGGANLADSQKAAILERGGMKFAFLGCNPVGPEFAWAREDGWPGAAPCGKNWPGAGKKNTGYEWMVNEITRLKAEGYIVIATFQYFEYYSPEPRPWQQTDFRRMAEAGATIVSGSQAHYSQAMEFYGDSFIHYGLGNLFFDQMGYDNPSSGLRTTNTRREFLDRHVFYDGQYLGVELLTAMLEDFAKPRPMTPEEREAFLEEYFRVSGWGR